MDFEGLKIVERRIIKGQSVELNPPFDNSAPEAVDWYQVFKHDAKHFALGPILVPIAPFSSLSRQGLGTRIRRALETYDFPVLDSRTSGLHV